MADHTPPRPGDKCSQEGCSGKIGVYSTRINFASGVRIRYLCCDACRHAPEDNKWVVPLQYAPQASRG